jgi:hypothetical protein
MTESVFAHAARLWREAALARERSYRAQAQAKATLDYLELKKNEREWQRKKRALEGR